jgi:predicted SAM-dependent methyltransferase
VGVIRRLKRTESTALRLALLRAAGAVRYTTHGHAVRKRRVERYLASAERPRLHLGAGPVRLPGWLNSDLISGDIQLDAGRRLPLPSGRFDFAFGEHLVEHLAPARAELMLTEVHRVLRPGGVLRLTTPDLKRVIAIYEDRNPVVSRETYARYLNGLTGKRYDQPAQILNDLLRLWGHRYLYDEEDLSARLRAAGFSDVVRREPGQSEHEPLRGVERHGEEWVNRAEAMCLEATRVDGPAA